MYKFYMSSAVIFGATGLAGSYLLKNLINDDIILALKFLRVQK